MNRLFMGTVGKFAYAMLCMMLFGILACGQPATPAATPEPKTTITIAYLDDPSRDAVLYGITEGHVTSNLIDVEISLLPLGTIIEAAPTKQFDAIEAAAVAVPLARARGLNFVILSQGLENHDGTLLFIHRSSTLTDLAQLKGEKIAVPSLGGTFTLETRYVLQEGYGLNTNLAGGDVQFIEAPPSAMPGMLMQGQVAAAVLLHVPAYTLINNPDFGILSRITHEFQGLTGRGSMNSVIVTYPETVELKGAGLQELNRMLKASLDYFRAHQDEVIAQVEEQRGVPTGFLDWWWGAQDYPQGPVDQHGEEVIETIWQAAQQLGDLESYPEVEEVLFSIAK